MEARAGSGEQQKRAVWSALVTEYLPVMQRFARREIAQYETAGDLVPGELSAEDVVNATLLRAQRDYIRRPVERNVRGWLIRRLREQLQADVGRLQARRERTVPLETDTSEFPNPAVVVMAPGEPLFYEPQELHPEDLFPDIDMPASPEQEAEAKELRVCVNEVLAEMPGEWRQALRLHYLDRFSAADLAEALGRPEPEARHMLEQARASVRRKLKQAGCSFKAEGESS